MDTYRCNQPSQMETNHRRQDKNLPDYVQTVVVKDSKGIEKILLLPKALDLDRPKRSRTAFAKWQLDALEATFCTHPYLVGEQRTLLARRLGLSETQIKVWYQNRRTKQRKEGDKSVESGNPSTNETSPPTEWQSSSPDLFGQAFQHYHPAMYHHLIQSYNSSHSNTTGAVNNLSAASANHPSVSTPTDRHQNRVY